MRAVEQGVPDRPTKSISVEDTFDRDVPLSETEPMIRRLAERVWSASRKESRIARTVILKLKTSEFNVLTRSHTPGSPPSSCEELTTIALTLRERVELSAEQRFRLVGIGLSNFREPEGTQNAASPFPFSYAGQGYSAGGRLATRGDSHAVILGRLRRTHT